MQSWAYCALNRHYAAPKLVETLGDLARDLATAHPGTLTLVLDAGSPFIDGFPLLPHLSHDDGAKAAIALRYRDARGHCHAEPLACRLFCLRGQAERVSRCVADAQVGP